MRAIYLDHAAATPMHPLVLESMLPYFTDHFGNPSSIHSFGRHAKLAVNRARDGMADALGCEAGEIVYTSGGTESDNLAIFGAVAARRGVKSHIIASEIEHQAVLNACRQLENDGHFVTYLPVDSAGVVNPEEVADAFRPETILVSVMFANNEVGSVQPVQSIGRLCKDRGVLFHVDAVQALGLLPIRLDDLPVDLMSFSAHKINGPKGIGALYVSRNTPLAPLLFGGSQERKRRAGTENVPGIIGFAAAIELACSKQEQNYAELRGLRELMIHTFEQEMQHDRFIIHGHPDDILPRVLNVSFPKVAADTMLMNLDLAGIAASSGSACSSGSLEVSHVLRAMHLSDDLASSAIRFSFGLGNSPEEVVEAARKTATIAARFT